jgi:hypothetical protein
MTALRLLARIPLALVFAIACMVYAPIAAVLTVLDWTFGYTERYERKRRRRAWR